MQLHQIFEDLDASPEVARLMAKIAGLKAEYKAIMKHAGSAFQSGVNPVYKDKVDRIKRQLAVTQDELEHAKSIPSIAADQRAAAARIAAQQAAVTPERKSQERGEAISRGFKDWYSLRSASGGDTGLNDRLHAAALKQTENGKYELDVEQLAQEFGIPARSLYRRLEDPALAKTAQLMPKNRR